MAAPYASATASDSRLFGQRYSWLAEASWARDLTGCARDLLFALETIWHRKRQPAGVTHCAVDTVTRGESTKLVGPGMGRTSFLRAVDQLMACGALTTVNVTHGRIYFALNLGMLYDYEAHPNPRREVARSAQNGHDTAVAKSASVSDDSCSPPLFDPSEGSAQKGHATNPVEPPESAPPPDATGVRNVENSALRIHSGKNTVLTKSSRILDFPDPDHPDSPEAGKSRTGGCPQCGGKFQPRRKRKHLGSLMWNDRYVVCADCAYQENRGHEPARHETKTSPPPRPSVAGIPESDFAVLSWTERHFRRIVQIVAPEQMGNFDAVPAYRRMTWVYQLLGINPTDRREWSQLPAAARAILAEVERRTSEPLSVESPADLVDESLRAEIDALMAPRNRGDV